MLSATVDGTHKAPSINLVPQITHRRQEKIKLFTEDGSG